MMNHTEQRLYLLEKLLAKPGRYQNTMIPKEPEAQKNLLRSLMNVWQPQPLEEEFLAIQDQYLTEETMRRGVVDGALLPATEQDSRIVLWRGDITRLQVDAIVNAANSALLGCWLPMHQCIDNIIHSNAGLQLRLACHQLMEQQGHDEPTGMAKITPAFNLPSRYVLHTVGPIISGALTQHDCQLLASCYRSTLELAAAHGLKSIAFCCISTGEFHFPPKEAAEIAIQTVRDFLAEDQQIERVIFDVFKESDEAIYQQLLAL